MTVAAAYRGNTIDINAINDRVVVDQVQDDGTIKSCSIELHDGPDMEMLYTILGEILNERYRDLVTDPYPPE